MPDEVPDIYCDSVQFAMTPYDIMLELKRHPGSANSTEAPATVGLIRMSHEHAKSLVIMLKINLKNYEEQMGAAIPLHPQLRQQLGISQNEDW